MSHKLNLRGALEQVRISHAARVLPVVRDIQGSGRLTLDELAAALNAQGIPTADGHNWSPARLRELFAEVRRNGRGEVGFEYVVLGAVIVAIISGIWSASVPTIIAALSSALTAIGGVLP